MKKILSLLLALSVIFASLALFSACSGGEVVPDGDGNTDDGNGATETAVSLSDFFALGENVTAPIKAALAGGSVKLSIGKSTTLFGEDFDGFAETLYFSEGSIVSDTSLGIAGKSYGARLFFDKNGVAAEGEGLFGSDMAYMVDFATMLDDMEESLLLTYFFDGPMDLEALLGGYDLNTVTPDSVNQLKSDVIACLSPVNGTEGGYATVTYTLNAQTMTAVCNKIADFMGISDEMREEIFDIDLDSGDSGSIVLYYGANDVIAKAVTTMTSEFEDGSSTRVISFAINENQIKYEVASSSTYDYDGETETYSYASALLLDKTVSGDTVTFALSSVDTYDDEEPIVFEGLRVSYNQATGAFTITANGTDNGTMTFSGVILTTDGETKIAITSITVEDVTVALDISLTFTASAVAPQKPQNAKNLLTLAEDEVEALLGNMENAPLTALLARFFSGMGARPEAPAPDDDLYMCAECNEWTADPYYIEDEEGWLLYILCPDCYDQQWGGDNDLGWEQ